MGAGKLESGNPALVFEKGTRQRDDENAIACSVK